MQATNQYPPIETQAPYELAKHKSRYSHKCWVAWRKGDRWFAARATAENLSQVLADIGSDGKAVLFTGSQGNHGLRGNAELVAIWQSNAAIGYLDFNG